ncbi:hypothetical protein [Caenimonas aquaedulcis]|uniref:Uncharacterized protein n=1 Tax=Caenimonas aquaedulcis TaxID=2793270 RepID=A0A931H442_9BURK|nr:hypothetical protein [Caenimonas aquaedulcis]MBG9388211.1 hypothetical protein [Caenimonas aquaedulcis]
MKKLLLAVVAVASLSAVAAFADAADQAGSAWNNHPLGAAPGVAPNWDPQNTADSQAQGYGYGYWGNRYYNERNRVAPAYPYTREGRAARRDRDGDGVPNAQDRYPDNSRRW